MCRFQKSQKRRQNGVEAVDTAAVSNDLRTHCGDGKRKWKLQGFPTNLHANGNTWEAYLGPRGTGICLRHMVTLKCTIPGHNCNWPEHIILCSARCVERSYRFCDTRWVTQKLMFWPCTNCRSTTSMITPSNFLCPQAFQPENPFSPACPLLNFSFKFGAGQQLWVFVYAFYIRSDKCLCQTLPSADSQISLTKHACNVWSMICGLPYIVYLHGSNCDGRMTTPICAICLLVCTLRPANFKDRQGFYTIGMCVRSLYYCHVQWGYSYCCPKKQAECCLPPYLAADFIVHTLWTVNSKREIEKSCNGPVFEKEEVCFANVFPTSFTVWSRRWSDYKVPCMSVVWGIASTDHHHDANLLAFSNFNNLESCKFRT